MERSKFTDYFADASDATSKKDKRPARKGTRFERHRVSRIMAIQALFESTHNQTDLLKVHKTFVTHHFNSHDHPIQPDRNLFDHLILNFKTHQDIIVNLYSALITEGWTEHNMDLVLISIIKMGISELLTPFKPTKPSIIICEYVEIAKGFFDEKESGYINKALDEANKVIQTHYHS